MGIGRVDNALARGLMYCSWCYSTGGTGGAATDFDISPLVFEAFREMSLGLINVVHETASAMFRLLAKSLAQGCASQRLSRRV